MTPDEQRIAIGTAIGFDLWVIVKQGYYYRPKGHGYTTSLTEAWKLPYEEAKKHEMYVGNPNVSPNEIVFIERAPLPDFLNSLDACAEMEKALKDETANDEFSRYCGTLSEMLCPIDCKGPSCGFTICATAPQRCEAFLKVMNKWVE
jgi:hypothetical protein